MDKGIGHWVNGIEREKRMPGKVEKKNEIRWN